jgi:hypothetical protein
MTYQDANRLKLDSRRNNKVLFTETDIKLPAEGPENEGTMSNDERANFALAGVRGFLKDCATDDCDAVADFLCDLMHLLDRMPGRYGTWADNLRRAENNYQAEIAGGTGPLCESE